MTLGTVRQIGRNCLQYQRVRPFCPAPLRMDGQPRPPDASARHQTGTGISSPPGAPRLSTSYRTDPFAQPPPGAHRETPSVL